MLRFRHLTLWTLILASLAVGSTGCTKQARTRRYLARAEKDYRAERYDRAEFEYSAVLRMPPQEPKAVRGLGLCYFAEGKLPQAFAFLRRSAQLDPYDLEVQLRLGQTCKTLRKLKEAQQTARVVLEREPANTEALLLFAESVPTNTLAESLPWLDTFPDQVKAGLGFHLARSTILRRLMELEPAEAEIKQALALDPNSSAAHLAMADLLLLRKDWQQVEPALRAAAELAPIRSMTRLLYADFRARGGAADIAQNVVEEITRRAPDYVPAWAFLAQLAFARGHLEDCASLLDQVLARDAANFDASLLRGDFWLAKGEPAKAVKQFENVAKIYGAMPQVPLKLGLAYLANGDQVQASAHLNQALAADPNFADATLALSQLNVRRGNAAAAVTSLTKLVARQPDLAQAHLLLAGAYLAQGNQEQAAATYRRMARFFPHNPQPQTWLGLVLSQQNRKTEARQAFKEALESAPDYLPAFEQLLELDLAENQYAAATERIKNLIERHPQAAEPLVLMAKVHLAQALALPAPEVNTNVVSGKLQFADTPAALDALHQAEAELQQAITRNPDLHNAYLLLAQIYLGAHQQEQALARLNTLVARTNDVTALMQIAILQQEQTNFAAAGDAYERLLSIRPKFSPALNNLAYLYSERLGRLDRAYELAERARELLPYDAATADTLGWILWQRGEYSRALGLLGESAAKLTSEPEVQFHLGMTYYMMGEEDSARATLKRALGSPGDFPGRAEAERRLAVLDLNVANANVNSLVELEQRLRTLPPDPIVLDRLGCLLERKGAYAEASKAFESAMQKNSKNVRMLIHLAQLYAQKLGDSPKALALAKQAHGLDPDDPHISGALGRLVYAAGDYSWAVSLLEESARQDSGPGTAADLAWAYYSVGRLPEAEIQMQTALHSAPTPAVQQDAARFLTMLALARDSSDSTESQKILAADPGYVPALFASAVIRQREGNLDEAARLYEKVLARLPLFTPAMRSLALFYSGRFGEEKRAYDLATRARSAFPDDAELAKALGVLCYKRGETARAAELLQQSAHARAGDAELLYYLGMTYYQLKQPVQGKDNLQRALALSLPAGLADQAKRTLNQL